MNQQNITLLPPYTRLFGVVTQARLLRLLAFYALQSLFGSGLIFFTQPPALQIFGLGLILPGGGFLAHYELVTVNGIGHLLAALSGFTLFIIGLGIWFGTGNSLAPPIAWLGTALGAAMMNHGTIRPDAISTVYASVSVMMFACILWLFLRAWLAYKQRPIDNAYLQSQQAVLEKIFTATESIQPAEMSLEDLQRLRFALDRALQPIDKFDGFEWLDQFQTAAVRYQLNFLGYGIAMSQARFTPAFSGYMDEAQVKLVDKQTEHRVWSYWQWENLWGNLKSNPDPLSQENIMYTGFVALQMALFTASSGRKDFSQSGRFKLLHPSGTQWLYEDAALIARLEHEYRCSDFFLIACEPNWIYPLCNMLGASAIVAHDVQTGQNCWQHYQQPFRQHLEHEFLDAFGRYVPCRSARTGLALPSIGGIMPLAMPCFFLNALAPDLAQRQWLLLRRQLFDKQGYFQRKAFWWIDTGNYGFSRASAYTATALAAAELGDEEVYTQCLQALAEECPSVLKAGVIHRQHASVWAHGVEITARAVGKNSFRNLLLQPHQAGGLRLQGLTYPEILVASAHVNESGLTAVLYAGVKDGVYEISWVGLQARRRYQVRGALASVVVADNLGQARVKVQLSGRTLVHIYPEEKV